MTSRFAVTLIFASVVAAMPAAQAQSSKVVNVVKMAAWAQVLANRCPKLEVNWTRYGTIMSVVGLVPQDIEPNGRHGKIHGAFIAEAINETGTSSESVVCATGLTLFGRNGRNVPGLLAPKE